MSGSEAVRDVIAALDDCGIPYILVGTFSTPARAVPPARLVSMLDRQVWLPTPEDVIVTKLHWALLANRSKDRDDACDVIAVQSDQVDWRYVHNWCERHGTRALLDEIRASIPPI